MGEGEGNWEERSEKVGHFRKRGQHPPLHRLCDLPFARMLRREKVPWAEGDTSNASSQKGEGRVRRKKEEGRRP